MFFFVLQFLEKENKHVVVQLKINSKKIIKILIMHGTLM